jgi:nucleoside-diphosphate-sugar epimerase
MRGATPIRGDLANLAVLARAAGAADGVVHLGAEFGPRWADIDRGALAAILSALDSRRPFVYTSMTLVYGDTGQTVADEDCPPNPPPFLAWRPAVERDVLATERSIRCVVLRVPTVYGRSAGSTIPALIQAAERTGGARYVGNGESRWSTVHVDDLADLYVLALEKGPPGTLLNAVAGPAVSGRRLAQAINHAIGKPAVDVSWRLDEARAALGFRADLTAMNHQVSGARAVLRLGWNPRGPSILYDVAYGSYRLDLPQKSSPNEP